MTRGSGDDKQRMRGLNRSCVSEQYAAIPVEVQNIVVLFISYEFLS